MAYTTNELISGAFYGAGIVSREFETVSGSQIADGLLWLNDILSETDVNQAMVPYESTYTGNFVANTETYAIANLVSIDTLTFTLDSVRYSMSYSKRNEYFGTPRVNNIQSLPYEWYFEKTLAGGTLYIYFKPDRTYPFEVHGIFRLSNVALGQDLSLTLAQFYRTYLRYALMDRICAEYNETTPVNVTKTLGKYQAYIAKKSRVIDLRMQKVSTLQRKGSFNYAFINLGKGWTPS